MTEMDETARRYVREVMDRLPPCLTATETIRRDIEAHLAEAVGAGRDPEEGIRQLGPAEEVAAGYARETEAKLASLGDRVGAFLLDLGLGIDLLALALVLIWRPEHLLGSLIPAFAAASALLSLLYFPILEERFGQTIGKRVFGLCVTRTGGLRLGLGRALLRRLPLLLEFFWLDAVFAPFTEKRQRAFDLVADTVVVATPPAVSRTLAWIAVLVVLSPIALVLWLGPAGFFVS